MLNTNIGFFWLSTACSTRFMAKAGLAHRRAPRDDHQVGLLQPRRLGVQLQEAGAQAGNVAARLEQLLDTRECVLQQRIDLFRTARLVAPARKSA